MDFEMIEELADFVSTLKNVEKVELLPFHKMGEHKWDQVEEKYELSNTEPPSDEEVEKAKNIFKKYGLKV